jgi:C-terminal processing protease CtpA/Prc
MGCSRVSTPTRAISRPAEYTVYKQHEDSLGKDLQRLGVTGLNVSKRYGYATVVSVIPGSPADKEQIEDGDIIESVEGQSTRRCRWRWCGCCWKGSRART